MTDNHGGHRGGVRALLMTELALTRIFSVTMYYHFAFLAISIALFGLSASGVFVYVMRQRLASIRTRELLTAGAIAMPPRDRRRAGLPGAHPGRTQLLAVEPGVDAAIYALAALPFFDGGAVISSRSRA